MVTSLSNRTLSVHRYDYYQFNVRPALVRGAVWSAVAFVTERVLRRKLRVATGQCEGCGYDLRASEGRCPECGRPFVIAGAAK